MAKQETENTTAGLDWLKWLAGAILIIVAVGGNIYYEQQPFLYRVIGMLVLIGLAGFVFATTRTGKNLLVLAKEARLEIRKVVWPTRQETLQTTAIVLVAIILVALMLWLFDSIFSWVISLFLG